MFKTIQSTDYAFQQAREQVVRAQGEASLAKKPLNNYYHKKIYKTRALLKKG